MIGKLIGVFLEAYRRFLRLMPVKKTVVFESNPEFSCNTYPVYRYLIDKKHLDDDFHIVWLVSDPDNAPKLKNTSYVKFWAENDSLIQRMKYNYVLNSSACLIYCNRLLGKNRKDQYSLCLQHGMPLKRSNGSYCINDNCDECLCVSEFFTDNYCDDFKISRDKLIYMGFPRNDYLFTDRNVLSQMGLNGYDKVIIWMPTYRKHTAPKVVGFNIEETKTGIPTINTDEEILKVDSWLRDNNCLLILKPHPIQKISVDIQNKITNFKIISNDDLKKAGVQLYELLGKTDALVTDYSSVYYDYLLTNKPIGLTVDDIDTYINTRGFVYDDPKEVLKGVYIESTDELLSFFADVKFGIDDCLDERVQIKNKIHKYRNGSCAEMIGEHIYSRLEKLK